MARSKQIEGQISIFDYLKERQEKEANYLIFNFAECEKCWCHNCKHNEKLEGEPREFAGELRPCPACEFCEKNERADICEIGSYEGGCKLRATEEGIYPPKE